MCYKRDDKVKWEPKKVSAQEPVVMIEESWKQNGTAKESARTVQRGWTISVESLYDLYTIYVLHVFFLQKRMTEFPLCGRVSAVRKCNNLLVHSFFGQLGNSRQRSKSRNASCSCKISSSKSNAHCGICHIRIQTLQHNNYLYQVRRKCYKEQFRQMFLRRDSSEVLHQGVHGYCSTGGTCWITERSQMQI